MWSHFQVIEDSSLIKYFPEYKKKSALPSENPLLYQSAHNAKNKNKNHAGCFKQNEIQFRGTSAYKIIGKAGS